jgi:hypothetical protein
MLIPIVAIPHVIVAQFAVGRLLAVFVPNSHEDSTIFFWFKLVAGLIIRL